MNQLRDGDALLIVDAQIDFFPGGALPVPQGNEIIPVINEWIAAAREKNIPIMASRDWHPANHCSFTEQGGSWPAHCVQNTFGATIHTDVHLPTNTILIDKATDPDHDVYSAFKGKNLERGLTLDAALKSKDIKRIWIVGLAMDYCVYESALEAREKGYEVHVLLNGTRAIKPETGRKALESMREAGVIIEEE